MRPHLSGLLLTFSLASVLAACSDDTKDDGDTDTVDTTPVDTDETVETDTVETDDTQIDTDALCWTDSELGACWDCAPPTEPGEDSLKFLDRCDNEASYVRYDNAAHIPSSTWVPGTPLPTIP